MRGGKAPSEQDLLRLTPEIVGWLAGVEPVSEAVIAGARRLRAISRNGVGVDNLPLAALSQREIALRTAGGANAQGVAELTIGLMFSAIRHIPLADSGIKSGRWPRHIGREIRGRTVGVVGYGAIGREVARLAGALDAKVLAYDPLPQAANSDSRVRHVDLETLIAEFGDRHPALSGRGRWSPSTWRAAVGEVSPRRGHREHGARLAR